MRYNLLIDTRFQINVWKFYNCKYEDGYLISNNKAFGIEQELTLSDLDKLYFRCSYMSLSNEVYEVKIGVQIKDTLFINKKAVRVNNKFEKISIIEKPSSNKIKVHLIFESKSKINKVAIKEPILVDLNNINKATWLRYALDKKLSYIDGYSYKNELKTNIIENKTIDFKDTNIIEAKKGLIIEENNNKKIIIKAKFNINQYYLAKIKFEEINRLGEISLNYGVLKSERKDNQIYLVFKANNNNELILEIEGNDVLPYQINLQDILLINITHMRLLKEDIPYIPYIGD